MIMKLLVFKKLANKWYIDLPWLKNYVSDKNLLIYCSAIDDRCYSIVDIEVSYFDTKRDD